MRLHDDEANVLHGIAADARGWDVDLEHDTEMEMAEWDAIDVEGDIAAWSNRQESERLALMLEIDAEPW